MAKTVAPDGWEGMTAPGQEPGEASRAWFERFYDTRPPSERSIEPSVLPKVEGEEAGLLIAMNPSDRGVMIAARRLYWRHLNDPFRDIYRAYIEAHGKGQPEFIPARNQRDNMEALVALLDGADGTSYDEVAELYRELGDFVLAHDAVRKAVPNRWDETLAPMLRPLIERRVSSPVRYRW